MALVENHFIKVRGDLKSSLDPNKNYYMQINSDGNILAEEATIPLDTIQSTILESQQEITGIENNLIGINDNISSNTSKITNLENSNLSLITDVNLLKTDNITNKTNITNLQNDNTTNKNDIITLINKTNSLENKDKIKVYKSTNLTINTTPTLINFDQTITNTVITNNSGEITIGSTGSYIGTLDLYVNQTSNPNIWFYIGHTPISTGTEVIYMGLGGRTSFTTDGSFYYHINGTMSLSAGDKIKIYAFRTGGNAAILESVSTTVNGNTITQYPAMLSFYKI